MLTRIKRRVRDTITSRLPASKRPKRPAGNPDGLTTKELRKQRLIEGVNREIMIDAARYVEHSVPTGGDVRYTWLRGMRLDASATRLYHRVEKGLVLPEPRRPFGADAITKISKVLANPAAKADSIYVEESKAVLAALEKWNETGELDDRVAPVGDSLPGNPISAEDAAAFMMSRRSIRHFSPEKIDRALITEAGRIAMSAPSVCNRQSWRAHYFDSAKDLAKLMPLHSGSGGFGDNVTGVFIVSYDLRTFEGTAERNQGWIDGGMYAQNLLLALHAVGLGAVPLNWSRYNAKSDELRAAADIPAYENIVMMIGVGHPAEGHRVARSTRRPLTDVLRFGSK